EKATYKEEVMDREWFKNEVSRFVDAVEELSTPRITLDVSDRVYDLLLAQSQKRVVIIVIEGEGPKYSGLTPTKGENGMALYRIPNDTPDGTYTLPKITVKDAEGEVITAGVKETFTSSDGDVLSVTPTGSESISEGTYHVGKSGVADVHHTVMYGIGSNAEPIYDHVDNFSVTKGAPVDVTVEGETSFSGITPVEPEIEPPAAKL